MPSVATIRVTDAGAPGINIDGAALEAPMKEALGRAAVFAAYASNSANGPRLKSVTLNSANELDVGMPDPIPPSERKYYQIEFQRWAVGQGLIELDQSYQRFLGSALDTKKDLDAFIANRTLDPGKKPYLQNTRTLHELFYTEIGKTADDHEKESSYLWSLSNARNCLAHDGGVVSERRLVEAETMPVRWPGHDTFLISKDGERSLISRTEPHLVRAEDIGSTLCAERTVREKVYRLNDVVSFTPTELAEITFFTKHWRCRWVVKCITFTKQPQQH